MYINIYCKFWLSLHIAVIDNHCTVDSKDRVYPKTRKRVHVTRIKTRLVHMAVMHNIDCRTIK